MGQAAAERQGTRHCGVRVVRKLLCGSGGSDGIKGSEFKIGGIVAAVDCGQIVNPESVRSQTEGAIIFGLSAALKNEIMIKNGAVEQTNFDG